GDGDPPPRGAAVGGRGQQRSLRRPAGHEAHPGREALDRADPGRGEARRGREGRGQTWRRWRRRRRRRGSHVHGRLRVAVRGRPYTSRPGAGSRAFLTSLKRSDAVLCDLADGDGGLLAVDTGVLAALPKWRRRTGRRRRARYWHSRGLGSWDRTYVLACQVRLARGAAAHIESARQVRDKSAARAGRRGRGREAGPVLRP